MLQNLNIESILDRRHRELVRLKEAGPSLVRDVDQLAGPGD